MGQKEAIFDIAAALARRVGSEGVGDRLDRMHASAANTIDRVLAAEIPGTKGVHLPTLALQDGRPKIVPFDESRQAPMRRMIAHNPEMALAIPAPVPGLETGLAAGKGVIRRALGLPLSGVPGTNTSVRAALGEHVMTPAKQVAQAAGGGVRGALGSAASSLKTFMKESSMSQKTAGGPEYRGRDMSAAFSTAAEKGNIQTGNAVLDGLFARKAEMAKRTEAQLGKLWKNKGYGRNRALGPTAEDAGSYFDKALKSGALG